MSDKALRAIAFAIFSPMFFVCTLLIIRWGIEFVTWTTIDAGWAQAIGSVGALGVAIYVMSRQNKHAATLIVRADRMAVLRRAASVHAILKRSHMQVQNMRLATRLRPLNISDKERLTRELEISGEMLDTMKKTFLTIPAYDLGSYDMAYGIVDYADTIAEYSSAIGRLYVTPERCGAQDIIALFDMLHVGLDNSIERFERGMKSLQT